MLTNEEQRVGIYAATDFTTTPGSVTPDTPLESLNLNWTERDLPERLRTRHVHRLHPYLGKFIPQLAEVFLRKYFRPGQTVLDPFVGSGTTLAQANELGIHAVGYDISAFNVLLCRAKTGRYHLPVARKEILDILKKTETRTQNQRGQLGLFDVEDALPDILPEASRNYLTCWFAPQALRELLTYRQLIDEEGYETGDLLKVILSRSARSSRLTTHFDLDFPKKPQTEPYWCYKHSRTCQPTTDAFQFIQRYSLDTAKRIEEFAAARTDAEVQVFHADSRDASIPPIDGVMTSPPYVGLIDYHDQHAYAYHLLGLEDRSDAEIGAASDGSGKVAKERYKRDIAQVFRNALDSMPSGGHLIVIAGDRANLYPEIAEMCGVDVVNVVQRHVNRRTGRRSGEFFESVFIWRKR